MIILPLQLILIDPARCLLKSILKASARQELTPKKRSMPYRTPQADTQKLGYEVELTSLLSWCTLQHSRRKDPAVSPKGGSTQKAKSWKHQKLEYDLFRKARRMCRDVRSSLNDSQSVFLVGLRIYNRRPRFAKCKPLSSMHIGFGRPSSVGARVFFFTRRVSSESAFQLESWPSR